MYLKSIEIQGFKSFANKIKLEFHNGITGIVGPNGSGKSNVSDAVRWVLGEQKVKQLRGAKMEDVIFAGTENRKPLGFAFVAITLDNSDHILPIDYDEVTVSRRLFRSGESEYMINGTSVRLKDINELFYDTGIGKDGYSIIGQGQIDKILSGKPEERRELFDEAVGIVKYKRRKAEALKKLENENQNLVRVEDILSELEKQVGPLEKQAETAKTYLRLRDDLKNADISLFLLQSMHYKKQIDELEQKKSIAENDMKQTEEEFANTRREYENLEEAIETLNMQEEEKKNIYNQSKLDLQKYQGQIDILQEQIHSAKASDEMHNSRLKALEESLEERKEQLKAAEKEKLEIEENLATETNQQDECSSRIYLINQRIADLQSKNETYKIELMNLINEKSAVKSKMERYDAILEQIEKRKQDISEKLRQFEKDKAEHQDKLALLEKEWEKVNQQITDTKKQLETFNQDFSTSQKNRAELKRKFDECQIHYHKQSSRLESLKNITERYEGYGNSIRRIMEQKATHKGIIGVVADIIKTEKKYETAIETALGGSIQNVVTDNEQTAKEMIAFLKKNKYGRATFLPLSSMNNKSGFTNESVFSETGVIGLACDLVEVKKEYQGVLKYLLGRTVVIDSIDHAILVARKYRYSLRIVTLEGEQLNPGGSMSGGAFKNSSNLLGRRREIADLEKELEATKEQAAEMKKQIAKADMDADLLRQEIEKTRTVLQEQYLLQNTIAMNRKQAHSKSEELKTDYQNFQNEQEQIGTQMDHLNASTSDLTDSLKEKEDKNAVLEKKIEEIAARLSEEDAKGKDMQKQLQDARLQIADLKSRHQFTVDTIKRLIQEQTDLSEEKEKIADSNSDSKDQISLKEEEIVRIQKQIEEVQTHLKDISDSLTKISKDKEKYMQGHKEFFEKREELQGRIGNLDREIYRLSSTLEKTSEKLEGVSNYIWGEYECTYALAKEHPNKVDLPLPELKKLVASLKAQIKNLGPVNVNAIEEFKNVGERYQFLKNQHNDLIEAKTNLLKIVDELETGMRKQFNEKFADIQKEFDMVFKQLFGGGKGEIRLDDDGDVLESGITIISQPPGKKLQNMMQMSGGEKALTAISLLFAIQNLKPSPFCLLDEIEAALDGSNVVRFAEYLHKLTEHTQFIVITHRRGTMNCADRLYGITMQEKGISTLVSVNLLESQLDK